MAPKPDQSDLFPQAPLPVAPLDDIQRLACLRLIRSENVGPATFRALINQYGGASSALAALPEIARRGGRTIRICPEAEAEKELAAANRIGATPLFTIEPGYPAQMAFLDQAPPMIYAKGRLELLNQPALAIIGSRRASAAGIKLTRMLATAIGEADIVIVSGLARGIDAAAHEAAITTGTVAVLAGGIDVIYPPEHDRLQRRIAEVGCLVSERPPGLEPRARDFPRRNRLISGISYAVLVIEAAKRSGTLITTRYALEQGRDVMAIPGHPLDPRAEGTNDLLKHGATLVTAAADVIEAFTHLRQQPNFHSPYELQEQSISALESVPPLETTRALHEQRAGGALHEQRAGGALEKQRDGGALQAAPYSAPTAPVTSGQRPPSPNLPDPSAAERVLTALGPTPVNVDELARAAQLPIQAVQVVLLELSLAGRIEQHGGQLVSIRDPEQPSPGAEPPMS